MQIGIGFWVRPDMISLIIPLLICYTEENWKISDYFWGISKIFTSTGVFIILYMLFHYIQSGDIFPNTFYAKQTEYAVLTTQPYFQRFLKQAILPLVGMGVLLVPGMFKICFSSIKRREWRFIAVIIWLLAYIGLYAWRLPVTYQHGRYMIPVMPIFLVLGILGTLQLSSELGFTAIARILRKSWQISMILITGIFWFLGARAYALDVAFIQSELVEGAQWISNNTPIDSVIAAHDIGALGYYGNREIVDLAGLINPDVIPIMRNEPCLEEYLNKIEITHLFIFPNWYPLLSQVGVEIYRGSGQFSKKIGGEPIVLYRWVTYQP